jgi:hypothetical protein
LLVVGLSKLPLGDRFLALPAGASGPLVLLAEVAAGGAALTALVAGVIRAVDGNDDQRSVLIQPPRQPAPFRRGERRRRPLRPPTRDLGTIILRTLANFVDHVGTAASLIARRAVHALRWLRHWIAWVLVSIVNALWRWLLGSLEVVFDGLALLPGALRRSTRVVAVPFACLLFAAWLTYLFAVEVLGYLVGGSLYALGALLANGAGAVLALTAAWIAISRQPIRQAVRSAGLTLSASGASALILCAIGGWTLGLFGTFGHGPIRVGWVTVASTAILVASTVWSWVRNRRNEAEAADVPLVAAPPPSA